jgi:four helix bundle protein
MEKQKFDLEERTEKFGEAIILISHKLPKDTVTRPIISQLVRAATSVGANYCEANNAESRNDFVHKIGICKKEAKETKYWLKMLKVACPGFIADADLLGREAQELTLIFSAISNSTRNT